jgi:hypothetical protein
VTSPQGLTTLVYPLCIPQGADWAGIDFPIIGPDGNPYDLSGCSALGQIRPSPGSGELYYTWSTSPTLGQGLITLTVETSTLNIRVLASESSLWTFSIGAYDILLTNPAAPTGFQESRVVMGQVIVSQEVTVL